MLALTCLWTDWCQTWYSDTHSWNPKFDTCLNDLFLHLGLQNLETLQPFCCRVAWSSQNICDGYVGWLFNLQQSSVQSVYLEGNVGWLIDLQQISVQSVYLEGNVGWLVDLQQISVQSVYLEGNVGWLVDLQQSSVQLVYLEGNVGWLVDLRQSSVRSMYFEGNVGWLVDLQQSSMYLECVVLTGASVLQGLMVPDASSCCTVLMGIAMPCTPHWSSVRTAPLLLSLTPPRSVAISR